MIHLYVAFTKKTGHPWHGCDVQPDAHFSEEEPQTMCHAPNPSIMFLELLGSKSPYVCFTILSSKAHGFFVGKVPTLLHDPHVLVNPKYFLISTILWPCPTCKDTKHMQEYLPDAPCMEYQATFGSLLGYM